MANPQATLQSPLLTVPQTAEYLNLPVNKVYELARSKDFPAVKLGKHWRILKDQLDQWLLVQLENRPDAL